MFVGLVLMLDFVQIVEASMPSTLCMIDRRQRRNIMVLSGLCSTSSHRWTGINGAALWGYGLGQKSHPFSRAITLAIPEKHAWARAVGNGKLLT